MPRVPLTQPSPTAGRGDRKVASRQYVTVILARRTKTRRLIGPTYGNASDWETLEIPDDRGNPAIDEGGPPQVDGAEKRDRLTVGLGGLVLKRATAPAGITRWVDRHLHVILPVPAVATILVIIAFPLAYTGWLSLHKWVVSAFSRPSFIGVQNYAELLGGDPAFWASVARTLLFTVLAVTVQMFIGLGMALIFHREFPGRGLARTLMLLPMTATPAAVGLLWTMMMDPDLGVLNYFLSLVQIPKSLWLASPATVIPAVVLVDTWEWGPLIALFCMAGLAVIPAEPYEAARIDGASAWQQFRFITLPLLRPILVVAMLFRAIDALKTFDILYVMTQGGPARASETINIFAYLQAFHYFNMGYSSSILVVFLALVLGISLMLISVRRGNES